MRRQAMAVTGGMFVAGCWALSAASLSQANRDQEPPIFRATTDLVAVDVSVRDQGAAVTGLTASDFTLTDNGVVQRVEALDAQAMPIDVTLIADVSRGTMSAWTDEVTPEETLERVRADVKTMAGLLRPEDRLRLLAIDTYVQNVFPMQPPAAVAWSSMDSDGLSSTFDALVTAMLRPAAAGRRHLIVAWTKTSDTVSATDSEALREVARRSDAVLHVVQRDTSPPSPRGESSRRWRPFRRFGHSALVDAAALSGGTFYPLGILSDRYAAAAFKEIFATFRTGYVLRYSPEGVRRDGWHEIGVTVPRIPGAEVRARRGYAVETGSTRPAPAGLPRASNAPSLGDLVATFERGDDNGVQTTLRRTADLRGTIREYRAAGNPWPAAPRREAMFVLELAASGIMGRDAETRAESLGLLMEHHDLVRAPLGPDRFECAWYGAAQAILQGALRAPTVLESVARRLERCPEAGALHLSRAIASDQFFSTTTARAGASRELRAGVGSAADVRQQYETAAGFADVAAEARIRAAWLAYRTGDARQAIADLDALRGPIPDPALRYYGHLVRAQALRAEGRIEDAITSFRAALTAWPGAQSARVGLMTLLLARGDRREAEALAETLQADPGTTVDPWWIYWQGTFRNFPMMLADLRELAK